MRVRIEPYQISDRPTVKLFVEAIQAFEARSVTGLKAAHEIGEPYTRKILRAVETNRGAILLAREHSESVGFICAWIDSDHDILLSENVREFAYVSDVFVRPAWRRKGVGRKLLKAVEAEMKNKGCARIRICSKAANSVALGAYAKAGYKPYEVTLTKRLSGRS
jgi:ribosomal protein S18 acetylase RimI-like enzyme